MTDAQALLADLRTLADDLDARWEEFELLDDLKALVVEYRASANPAPYTNERALIERLEHLILKCEATPNVSREQPVIGFDGTCIVCDADVRCPECGCDFDPAYYTPITVDGTNQP